MRMLYLLLVTNFLFSSCIPLQLAPNFEGGKVFKPKKFKRQLPQQYVYVFEDPKDVNEFYNYINAKFQIYYDDATGNVPVLIAGNTYFLTFYEAERATKTVNLVPMLVDNALENEGYSPVLENVHTSRKGKWYIALTVTDDNMDDGLNPKYVNHAELKT